MMIINQGDRLPDLVADLSGASGPADLTTATVRVQGFRHGLMVIDREVTGTSDGVISMAWQEGDTDLPGVVGFRWVTTTPEGKMQTFPPSGLEWVRISPDPTASPAPPISPSMFVEDPDHPGLYFIPGVE